MFRFASLELIEAAMPKRPATVKEAKGVVSLKKMKRYSTPALAASKKLLDHFKGFGHLETDVKLIDGPHGQSTLRQRLEKDIELVWDGNTEILFVPTYYASLRNAHRSVGVAFTALKPDDPDAKIDNSLYRAILETQKNPPDRTKIRSWMLGLTSVPAVHDCCAFSGF